MSRNVPSHHKPYPELVERRPHAKPYWIIDTTGKPWLPTNGMTSLVERKLLVPLVPGARSVARHELGHVKWSPKRVPKVDFDPRCLMAVEDARLNLGLARIRVPVLLSAREQAQVGRLARQDLADKDPFAFVLRTVAAQGTNAERTVLEALEGQTEALRDLVVRHVRRVRIELLRARRLRRRPVASFKTVLRVAEELARSLVQDLRALGYSYRRVEVLSGGCCLGHGGGNAAARRRHAGRGEDPPEEVSSGRLRTVVAPLVHPAPPARFGHRGKARAASEGTLPRHFHRWAVDRAIFRRSSPARGGTVLVDTSGSMSLDAAGIDEILSASSGAAQVAIYSGSEAEGELRIVARDGRRADSKDLVPFGRGNIVDEPALAWLARQVGPLVWISDGGVTGIGDKPSAALARRCQEIVERHRIRRVRTVQEAAACLQRGGRHAGVA